MRHPKAAISLVLVLAAVVLVWRQVQKRTGSAEPARAEKGVLHDKSTQPIDSPSEEPSMPESRRETVWPSQAPVLRGSVVSGNKEPIVEARIVWLALSQKDTEPSAALLDGWGVPIRPFLETISGNDGAFFFDHDPAPELAFGSLLIATHGDYLTQGVYREVAPKKPRDVVTIVLQHSPVINVVVVDAAGSPKAGARVYHLPKTHQSGAPPDALVSRFLGQQAVTDDRGHAHLQAYEGEQALWAELGNLVSVPWEGHKPTKVVLTVSQTFSLGGSIAFSNKESWEKGFEGERRILVSGMTGNVWRPLKRLRDVQEGEWGDRKSVV